MIQFYFILYVLKFVSYLEKNINTKVQINKFFYYSYLENISVLRYIVNVSHKKHTKMNEFERERQVTLIKTYTYIVNCVLIFELKIKTEKSSNFTGIFNFILSIGFSHMSKFPTVSFRMCSLGFGYYQLSK